MASSIQRPVDSEKGVLNDFKGAFYATARLNKQYYMVTVSSSKVLGFTFCFQSARVIPTDIENLPVTAAIKILIRLRETLLESWLTLYQPADKAQELSEPRKIILDMLFHGATIVIIQLLNLIVAGLSHQDLK